MALKFSPRKLSIWSNIGHPFSSIGWFCWIDNFEIWYYKNDYVVRGMFSIIDVHYDQIMEW